MPLRSTCSIHVKSPQGTSRSVRASSRRRTRGSSERRTRVASRLEPTPERDSGSDQRIVSYIRSNLFWRLRSESCCASSANRRSATVRFRFGGVTIAAPAFRLLGFRFEHPHVIHEHRRREYRIRLRIAVEMATDGEVQDEIKWLAQNRPSVAAHLVTVDGVVHRAGDEESHSHRIPLDGERVEVAGKRTALQSWAVRKRCVPGIARAVHGGARDARLTALVLHDVELASLRPWNCRE